MSRSVSLLSAFVFFVMSGCSRDLDGPKQVSLAPAAPQEPPGSLVEGRVEKKHDHHAAAAANDYEQRIADARRTVDITVYGASWCPSCRQTRAWLDANGMAYNERDVDRSEEANRSMRRLNPAGTIPVIDVEGEVVVGFAPDAVDRAIRKRAERRVRMN